MVATTGRILQKDSRRESIVEGNANLSAIFKEALNIPKHKNSKASTQCQALTQTVKG